MSPSYSHPSSVFTTCSLDSPLSTDFHLRDQNLPLNNRSNHSIAEVELEMDMPICEDFSHEIHSALFGPDVAASPRIASRGRMSVKPVPPMVPQPSPVSGPVNLSELNQRFAEMYSLAEPRSQYFAPTEPEFIPVQPIRRDSNTSIGTFYSSMPSDDATLSANNSRRMSNASVHAVCHQMSPPYDPISAGSSRRSSEPTLAPTFSGYQQKMHMRNVATAQRWQATPQPQQPIHAQFNRRISHTPGPAPSIGSYHGMRRSSEPVGLGINHPSHRVQPLTRQNLLRHNSVCAGRPPEPVYMPENFKAALDQEEPLAEERENLLIPDDMVRYLSQVAEAARLERELDPQEESDNECDLPIIPQNYPAGPPDNLYGPVIPMQNFSGNQRSASYSHGMPPHMQQPRPPSQRRPSQPANPYQPDVYVCAMQQRQRRGGLVPNCGMSAANSPRPMTEGSPDSYQVSSTTNDLHGGYPSDGSMNPEYGQIDGRNFTGMPNGDINSSNMALHNVNNVMHSLEQDRFYRMVQS